MTCPRCKARLLRQPDRTWYCLNHGEILSSEQQEQLDQWRKLNAEIAGDTRKMRGGLGKGTVPTRVVPEMGVTRYGRWYTVYPEPRQVSNTFQQLSDGSVRTRLGRWYVRATVGVRAVQTVSAGSAEDTGDIRMRPTDSADSEDRLVLHLPGSEVGGCIGASGHGRREQPAHASRQSQRGASRMAAGARQLRMAI